MRYVFFKNLLRNQDDRIVTAPRSGAAMDPEPHAALEDFGEFIIPQRRESGLEVRAKGGKGVRTGWSLGPAQG